MLIWDSFMGMTGMKINFPIIETIFDKIFEWEIWILNEIDLFVMRKNCDKLGGSYLWALTDILQYMKIKSEETHEKLVALEEQYCIYSRYWGIR